MTPKSFGLTLGLSCILTSTALAKPPSTVSAAVVFAVDRSSSISNAEMFAQVKAQANVLRSSDFFEKALGGDRCVGLHYLEWSGVGDVHSVLPWTVVCSRAQAEAAASEIEQRAGRPSATPLRARSSLSFAIDSARAAMKTMPFRAHRKVISISTDGSSNDGVPPAQARDRAMKENYIINAIALAPSEPGMEGDLKTYLRRNVIAGEGAFALAAQNLDDYAELVWQKTLSEIQCQERRSVNYQQPSSSQ